MFPESEFTLSGESRLPRWFKLPDGTSRQDLNVKMSYYYDHVKFELSNKKSFWPFSSEVVRGEVLNERPLKLQRVDPRLPPGYRVEYSVVKVNGVIEIVEHFRTEPVFDLSDDPEVRAQLFELLRTTQGIKGLN